MNNTDIDRLSINCMRFLGCDAIEKANSGHPGIVLGAAPLLYLLYSRVMKYNPADPKWIDRDRFVLSAGHGSALLYSALYLAGYAISIEDIKQFRQKGSITPGHPEYGKTPGVETTTGPLGQGLGNAVGMALAYKHLAALFNRENGEILNNYTYVLCGDGDMMEGISHEAASFAGHNGLSHLIAFYDNNGITIDGSTDLAMSDDAIGRFSSYGWFVQHLDDINDIDAIEDAIKTAKQQGEKPSLIILDSHIGYGAPTKQDSSSSHGSPLGADELRLAKRNLSWPENASFFVPEGVKDHFEGLRKERSAAESKWMQDFNNYSLLYPEEANRLKRMFSSELPSAWQENLPEFEPGKKIATRSASGKVLNSIAADIPELFGGSADLSGSNNTFLKGFEDFSSQNPSGRNLHFGIREHAMGAILNGLSLYGGLIPYGGTFLIFSDYMRPPIRLSALMGLKVCYVFTHDSIGLGEDGPTHQPIEQLASLRAIPGLRVFRPCDANETSEGWKYFLNNNGPVAFALSRQALPVLDRTVFAEASSAQRGAYVLSDCPGKPEVILIGSGSEVSLCLHAQKLLLDENINARVVSCPSMDIFLEQDQSYIEEVLPKDVKSRLSVEAGLSLGWERLTGSSGGHISIETFGQSAPAEELFEEYGFSPSALASRAKGLLKKN